MNGDRTIGDDRTRSSDELWAGLVVEMAAMPDVVANLLRDHQPDEHGFCTGNGCGTAGRGVPSTRWPCSLHTLASAAKGARATPSEPPDVPAPPPPRADERPVSTAAAWLIRRR